MPLEILTIPCLSDNYAYLLRCSETGQVGVVDAPEAAPILDALTAKGWPLHFILITHHHADHIQGCAELVEATSAMSVGAKADQDRLPKLDIALSEGDKFALGKHTARILDVSGHTINHIAYVFDDAGAAFTADSLMALGCGRVFEGTFAQMWDSLQKLAQLPPETLVYSGHEYTSSNAKFAQTIEPDNKDLQRRSEDIATLRAANKPTVPASLALELATNPFLRANNQSLKATLGMADASDLEVFSEIRKRKDNF